MSTAQIQYTVPELLTRAGATLRPNDRADCPKCGKRRAVSYTRELYCCHHAGCDFNGNDFRLARDLGLLLRPSPAELERRMEARERAKKAAELIGRRIKAETFELQGEHRSLLDVHYAAEERLKANPNDAVGRDLKAYAERERLKVLSTLAVLEDAPPGERLAFLNADNAEREKVVAGVIETGGLCNSRKQFIEVGV